MATDINNMTSAVASPVALRDRDVSGREAARTLAISANQLQVEDSNVKNMTSDAVTVATKIETTADSKSKNADLEKQVQDLHGIAALKGWSVNFSVDKDLDRTVVKVVDSKTKETIRQIPSEEWLYTAKRLKEFSELNDKQPQQLEPGLLFDKKV